MITIVIAVDATPGPLLDRLELAPWLGWLRRSQPRALAVHEHGLIVTTGRGDTFIAWADIQSLVAAIPSAPGAEGHGIIELNYAPDRRLTLSPRHDARGRTIELIVERAGLEWVHVEAHGRKLPPIACKPDAAANLRASLSK